MSAHLEETVDLSEGRITWRRTAIVPTGTLSITFDLIAEDLTPTQLQAVVDIRRAFFAFARDGAHLY
jgi:hypothetical protein